MQVVNDTDHARCLLNLRKNGLALLSALDSADDRDRAVLDKEMDRDVAIGRDAERGADALAQGSEQYAITRCESLVGHDYVAVEVGVHGNRGVRHWIHNGGDVVCAIEIVAIGAGEAIGAIERVGVGCHRGVGNGGGYIRLTVEARLGCDHPVGRCHARLRRRARLGYNAGFGYPAGGDASSRRDDWRSSGACGAADGSGEGGGEKSGDE